MTKILFPFIFVLTLISCEQSNTTTDYFGQTLPDSIPILFAPDLVSVKGRLEHGISFTPDVQEMAFGILAKEDYSGDIYYSNKDSEKWTKPLVFEPLKSKCVKLPYFSPNGKSLLYAQSKPNTYNGLTDIYIIEKINGVWNNSRKIDSPISSTSREANASMTKDGSIYFSSNRNCEGKENCHTADLFYAKLGDNGYERVQEVDGLISPNDEESVFISPNEDYILFCRYTGNQTWVDLYISYRDINNNWIEPKILNSTINSKEWDRRPFVSVDNKFLFYTRLQVANNGITESDIYWVNTTKVFKPFVFNPLSDVELNANENFKIPIPSDYFKDIDGKQLTLSINQKEFDWLAFDSEKMVLSGLPTQKGNFELVFTASDKNFNSTHDKITIEVK